MDQVQMLREQNQSLKQKVTALTLALDKAMRLKQDQGTFGMNLPSPSKQQSDINRRLNDLLNAKD
jgi:hypothetical protein